MRAGLCLLCLCVLAPWMAPAGGTASPLQVIDKTGGPHDLLKEFNNEHNVVLIFWQSWCAPCRAEAPAVSKAVAAYAGKLGFYGVVSGPDKLIREAKVDAFIKEFSFLHPQIRDRDLALTKRYNVRGTPMIIVLGKNETILYRGTSLPEDFSPYLRR